ncbi:MAG: Gx transporter family protein [Oscillospiraceae bacterium]|nr:Gx transporter family protein [Oscillospiraceae bacterium]
MDVKRLTKLALLTAVALILFVVEAQIPAPVPIPGVKLGLANIVTVYAMFRFGPRDTLLVLLTRVVLGSVFAGSVMALWFSLAGGLLCWAAMAALRKVLTERQLWVCGILGAMCHNLGQMAVCLAVYRSWAVAVYLPVLLLSGIVTGLFTGLTAQFLLNRLRGRL